MAQASEPHLDGGRGRDVHATLRLPPCRTRFKARQRRRRTSHRRSAHAAASPDPAAARDVTPRRVVAMHASPLAADAVYWIVAPVAAATKAGLSQFNSMVCSCSPDQRSPGAGDDPRSRCRLSTGADPAIPRSLPHEDVGTGGAVRRACVCRTCSGILPWDEQDAGASGGVAESDDGEPGPLCAAVCRCGPLSGSRARPDRLPPARYDGRRCVPQRPAC